MFAGQNSIRIFAIVDPRRPQRIGQFRGSRRIAHAGAPLLMFYELKQEADSARSGKQFQLAFRALADFLEYQFKPLQLFGRYILEDASDEGRVRVKDRGKHVPSLSVSDTIPTRPSGFALYSTEKSVLVRAIDHGADRSLIEVNL
jgi:hypothetical protein